MVCACTVKIPDWEWPYKDAPLNNSVAHILALKDTPEHSQMDLESKGENSDAQLNAFTSGEQTVFCVKFLCPRIVLAITSGVETGRI